MTTRSGSLAHLLCVGLLLFVPGLALAGPNEGGTLILTRFHIRGDQDREVVTQKQNDSTWAADPYGGYMVNGPLVGATRTIATHGCLLTCLSMIANYFGAASTPDTLNSYLQRTRGWGPKMPFLVSAVRGQSVGDTVIVERTTDSSYVFQHGDRAVIERIDGSPMAGVQLIDTLSHGELSSVILDRYGTSDTIHTALPVIMYVEPIFRKISKFIIDSGGSPLGWKNAWTADDVERSLAQALPAILAVNPDSHCQATHAILGDGMTVHYDPIGGQHRGTYSIHDPASQRDDLVSSRGGNVFMYGIVPWVLTGKSNYGQESVTISLSGPAHLWVSVPDDGGEIWWDWELGRYASGVDGALAIRGLPIGSVGDSVAQFVSDHVELPGLWDGDYAVNVIGDTNGSFALDVSGSDRNGQVTSAHKYGYIVGGGIMSYSISYSSEPGSAVEIGMDPAGVDGRRFSSCGLSVAVTPTPVVEAATIRITLASAAMVRTNVYDVAGRSVGEIAPRYSVAGGYSIGWRPVTPDGRALPSGVYFLRVSAGADLAIRRILILR